MGISRALCEGPDPIIVRVPNIELATVQRKPVVLFHGEPAPRGVTVHKLQK